MSYPMHTSFAPSALIFKFAKKEHPFLKADRFVAVNPLAKR